MSTQTYQIGMIGLGVMGRNMLLNMADHGYSVAGYDKDLSKVESLRTEAADRQVKGAENLAEFITALNQPRAVMLLVPAGPPVDAVIRDLLPHLESGDLIIDGGNSFFKDTDLRLATLATKGIRFLGVGVSGGEEGARHGPSMMPGGDKQAYEQVQPIFEAIAAQVNGAPCVTYLGPGAAGHYVKMVHNGIEYGLMQLIAESYDILKRGLSLSDDELHESFSTWNQRELQSYLIEITAAIFCHPDDRSNKRLIDVILDEAKQKGTGIWTSQNAMELQVPTPTIDIAVAMRDLSSLGQERHAASQQLHGPPQRLPVEANTFLFQLGHALYASMITVYAQGMALLRKASQVYHFDLNLAEVARVWRGGCIIRAALLEAIRAAYQTQPDLPNLMLDRSMAQALMSRQANWRAVVGMAAEAGIPTPGLMASLAYFDAYRSNWLPANLIQAQRDFFGAHTYERIDVKGVFHTRWEQD